MSAAVLEKIARIRAGARPRVLDLFAGCGGLSLGFYSAGFELKGAIESDELASRSYGHNFHQGDELHSRARDITRVSPSELSAEFGWGNIASAIDVIVGGPPCQAFARVGRPKLREIEDHPEAFKRDPRALLYREYLSFVDAVKPLALLIENVPDVLNHGGQNIAEEICEVLTAKGYVCSYTLLNAAFYGVPQLRERMFLIAYRRELASTVTFPAPTHWARPPSGYEGSRAFALKLLRDPDLFTAHSYVTPRQATSALPHGVTAGQAIGDLPAIDARALLAKGELRRGARRFIDAMPYPAKRTLSAYAKLMRTWNGFEAADGVKDHVIRTLPRDFELFARLGPGDQYPEAHRLAVSIFERKLASLRRAGKKISEGSAEYSCLLSSIVPPYDVGKFPNKWWKLDKNAPVRTLMAHLSKDSYSHIHYDGAQARTISVREAARLQSFPDGFVFSGTMNPAFRQIGNAVPPLLAKALANEIMKTIRCSENQPPNISSAAARRKSRKQKERSRRVLEAAGVG